MVRTDVWNLRQRKQFFTASCRRRSAQTKLCKLAAIFRRFNVPCTQRTSRRIKSSQIRKHRRRLDRRLRRSSHGLTQPLHQNVRKEQHAKSHVGMGHDECPICGAKHNEAVLLNTHLRNTLNPTQTIGISECPECATKINDDYVALVAIDESRSTAPYSLQRRTVQALLRQRLYGSWLWRFAGKRCASSTMNGGNVLPP